MCSEFWQENWPEEEDEQEPEREEMLEATLMLTGAGVKGPGRQLALTRVHALDDDGLVWGRLQEV